VKHAGPQGLYWLRFAGAAAALGLLCWTFADVDVARMSAVLGRVNGASLLLVLVPMGLSLTAESLGWAWAFRRFGHAVPLVGLWRARVTSEALALTLPAGMLFCESTKPFLLRKHCGLALEASVAGMAVRKYLLLTSQSVYIGGFALLGAPYLRSASTALLGGPGLDLVLYAVTAVVLGTAIASGVSLRDGRIAERLRAALIRLPIPALRRWLEHGRERFSAMDGELRRFFSGSLLSCSAPALLFIVGWVIEAFETYLILRILGVDLPFAAVAALEVSLSFLRHVTFLLPAGLGVQDLGYVAFLRALGAHDPLIVGAAFVLLKRAKECMWALFGFAMLASDLRAQTASPVPRRAFAVQTPSIE
jgi:uncharacterized membrane protein YbhN (UPF0104 family)